MSYDRDFQVKKTNKVYISNLPYATTESDLRESFKQYGEILSVNLKQKEDFTFAFVEFERVDQAEDAINQQDGKPLNGGNEVKVKFARGGNERRGGYQDRGRGGYGGGDRGGFQSRGGYDGPRRDFGGDRPRGCFNCGEEGHMIKDCPKPKKPREFNNNREGGFERRPYDNNREGGDRQYGGNRSYGGDRGGYGGDRGGNEGRGGYQSRGGYGGDRSRGYGGGDRKGYDKRRNSSSRSRSPQKGGRRGRSPSSGSR